MEKWRCCLRKDPARCTGCTIFAGSFLAALPFFHLAPAGKLFNEGPFGASYIQGERIITGYRKCVAVGPDLLRYLGVGLRGGIGGDHDVADDSEANAMEVPRLGG